MPPPADDRPRGGLAWLKREWLLIAFGVLAVVLAIVDPRPLDAHRRWLQLPTLGGLMGLMIAIQSIGESGLVQHLASGLTVRMHSLRALCVVLVLATALASMVLTNDVSLFLLVPLTVAIGGLSNLPVARMVVLEALAVNAGSALSPIGNPQNLLLWQFGHASFFGFVAAMAVPAAVMLVLVVLVALAWLPGGRIALKAPALESRGVSYVQALLSLAAVVSMVMLMERGHGLIGALTLLFPFAVFDWRMLLRIDWLLLLTLAAIFMGLGHFAALGWVGHALDRLDFSQPLHVYIAGIAASQLISNVPATVLLLDRAPDPLALAVAVNVGGFGVAIGSLANLIALRLARQPHGLRLLHLVSIPFLLVCAPLVYWIWRAVG